MRDQDKVILHEILSRGDGFGHRQHVELAWRYLAQHDTPAGAADAMRLMHNNVNWLIGGSSRRR